VRPSEPCIQFWRAQQAVPADTLSRLQLLLVLVLRRFGPRKVALRNPRAAEPRTVGRAKPKEGWLET